MVLLMHQSFYVHAPHPHLRGKPWNSRAYVQDNYFLIVSAVPGKCGGYKIWTLTWDFLLCRAGKEQGCYHQLFPTGRGLYQGSENWKSLYPPIPVGGGAVDTHDWCIILWYSHSHARVQRGDWGSNPPPPSTHTHTHTHTHLENHKATQPAFNVGPSSTRQRNAI